MRKERSKMDENMKKAGKVQIEMIIKALERRNMNGYYCDDAAEAAKTVLDLIEEGDCVSWGGSATLDEIGIKKLLAENNYEVIDPMSVREDRVKTHELRRKALTCDVFLSSANAVTLDGEIVNIDGTGNRVAATIYGPDKVIFIVGTNKIVRKLEDAEDRIKSDACPPNCIRLGKKTPCAITGKCGECLIPGETVCSYTVVTRFSPDKERMHVVLVNEPLGF